jgi:methylmalonyl-CoA mutase N-terminal domain/subunit
MSDRAAVTTDSGIPIQAVYTSDDVAAGLDERLGLPGEPPFTRGPYGRMYRDRPWTMRQYSGFGSAEDTNNRYRYLLAQGQTALSVAFDLPTQLGLDSDHELADQEVGRVGVAIDSAQDMCDLFDGLPLGELSVNFTINATAPILLAFYLVAAERQGVPRGQLAGTVQNDILKEFLARKTFVFPPEASVRIACDVVEYCAGELPRFNPISITGYHAREAGCTATQEVAFTFADAIEYCDHLVARGLDFDSFAPRLSFHFSSQMDFFEEVAKVRAARRIWHHIATSRYGATDPNSARLRFFSGCSGATLTAQQPLNNVVRSTLQCLAAVLGGAQSIHVMGFDEALEIPTEESVRLALRTQQIIALESGITATVDPLAGSFFVENLTDAVQAEAMELLDRIQQGGGAATLIEQGVLQGWIADNAFTIARETASGERPKVGVNIFQDDDEEPAVGLFQPDASAGDRQVARLLEHRQSRDNVEVANALAALAQEVEAGANVMPAIVEAARRGGTVGEIADVLRNQFGEYREPAPW